MKNSTANGHTPSRYRAEFVDVLSRVEITTGRNEARCFDDGIAHIAALIAAVRSERRKAVLIGNGGSAAVASHAQNDLCKAAGVRALVFTEASLLTAIANDDGYGDVFRRPVALWSRRGDLLIAISSSGESTNIVQAVAAGRERRCSIVTLTGFSASNRLRRLGDVNVYVPASHYGHVETAHALIVHCAIDLVSIATRRSIGPGAEGLCLAPCRPLNRP